MMGKMCKCLLSFLYINIYHKKILQSIYKRFQFDNLVQNDVSVKKLREKSETIC